VAPAPSDSSSPRVIPIPAPTVERLNDPMPVFRSGCWNPLFPATARTDTLILLLPRK
jgi:hypothetical protein